MNAATVRRNAPEPTASTPMPPGPTMPAPGAAASAHWMDKPTASDAPAGQGRQLPLLTGAERVAPVPYAWLVDKAESQVRREVRKIHAFDWLAFTGDAPEWSLAEQLHRKAIEENRRRGLVVAPTDVPMDVVLKAVRSVIDRWTAEPRLRPTEADFVAEQSRRGDLGRQAQQQAKRARNLGIMQLVQEGIHDAEIARRTGLSRSQVGRIRRDNAKPVSALAAPAPAGSRGDATPSEPTAFPAPEIPPAQRWPARAFTGLTGMDVDADVARRLVHLGQCAEAEGPESVDEFMAAIRASAGEGVRDPWAYLQQCCSNRGDAWTVPPELLGSVLDRCGEPALDYALRAMAGGYVSRPLPYLQSMLANAKSGSAGRIAKPVAVGVYLARKLAPALVIPDADAAKEEEERRYRNRHLDDYRRRHGRLPWEPAPNRCIGLKDHGDDSSKLDISRENVVEESSPGHLKADATPPEPTPTSPPLVKWERNERPMPASAATGTAGNERETTPAEPASSPPGERRRCRSKAAPLLISLLDLDTAALSDCAVAGCRCQQYTAGGQPRDCPCHWSPHMASRMLAELREIYPRN